MIFFILAFIGACIGSAINVCIYTLGYKKSAANPWSKITADVERKPIQRIPVLGWLFRLAEHQKLGSKFWLRPLLIELVWLIGLPLFYWWHLANGLTETVVPPAGWSVVWFVGHSLLFALLFVATFIDFDQRIIPDGVIVPGTLIALVLASMYPSFRLPETTFGLAGPTVASVDFAAAVLLPDWHSTTVGLVIALAIFLTWILALLPKFPLMAINLKSLQVVFASTIRFLQKNGLKVRRRSRRTGLFYLAIGTIGAMAIATAYNALAPAQWDSLFGALVGLGFGGMMVWSVRIVASHSLGQEAMGFGDVTLMAMIGAFLGWQAALIVFTLSPFAALAIVLVNYLVTKENELAFGPYLCLGALITVFGWSSIWPFARMRFFLQPEILIAVLAVSLVLLMIMMIGIRKLKENKPQHESQED